MPVFIAAMPFSLMRFRRVFSLQLRLFYALHADMPWPFRRYTLLPFICLFLRDAAYVIMMLMRDDITLMIFSAPC